LEQGKADRNQTSAAIQPNLIYPNPAPDPKDGPATLPFSTSRSTARCVAATRSLQAIRDVTHASFDHHVGTREQRGWYFETECLGRSEIDHQLKLRWLLDWQIGRLRTLENLVDEPAA
jgi:hypothetical protein